MTSQIHKRKRWLGSEKSHEQAFGDTRQMSFMNVLSGITVFLSSPFNAIVHTRFVPYLKKFSCLMYTKVEGPCLSPLRWQAISDICCTNVSISVVVGTESLQAFNLSAILACVVACTACP